MAASSWDARRRHGTPGLHMHDRFSPRNMMNLISSMSTRPAPASPCPLVKSWHADADDMTFSYPPWRSLGREGDARALIHTPTRSVCTLVHSAGPCCPRKSGCCRQVFRPAVGRCYLPHMPQMPSNWQAPRDRGTQPTLRNRVSLSTRSPSGKGLSLMQFREARKVSDSRPGSLRVLAPFA